MVALPPGLVIAVCADISHAFNRPVEKLGDLGTYGASVAATGINAIDQAALGRDVSGNRNVEVELGRAGGGVREDRDVGGACIIGAHANVDWRPVAGGGRVVRARPHACLVHGQTRVVDVELGSGGLALPHEVVGRGWVEERRRPPWGDIGRNDGGFATRVVGLASGNRLT
jgi:hypothetical protein